MAATVDDLLGALKRALGKERRRFYVFGAQAVAAWGVPRATADVDVTVELDDAELAGLLKRLTAAGFAVRDEQLLGDFKRSRVVPLVHRKTKMPVDLIAAGSELEEGFLARAVMLPIGRTKVPVISAEDLIVTKLLAGRPKDHEDVRQLLDLGTVELGAVRALLARIEEAIDRTDLRASLDRLMPDAARRR